MKKNIIIGVIVVVIASLFFLVYQNNDRREVLDNNKQDSDILFEDSKEDLSVDMNFLSSCNHVTVDDGQEIIEGSERQFSIFIKQIMQDVCNTGTYFKYREFENLIAGE